MRYAVDSESDSDDDNYISNDDYEIGQLSRYVVNGLNLLNMSIS